MWQFPVFTVASASCFLHVLVASTIAAHCGGLVQALLVICHEGAGVAGHQEELDWSPATSEKGAQSATSASWWTYFTGTTIPICKSKINWSLYTKSLKHSPGRSRRVSRYSLIILLVCFVLPRLRHFSFVPSSWLTGTTVSLTVSAGPSTLKTTALLPPLPGCPTTTMGLVPTGTWTCPSPKLISVSTFAKPRV